jgi:hypothetical protein
MIRRMNESNKKRGLTEEKSMMTFDEKIEWLLENANDIHSYEDMKDIVKHAIDVEHLNVAIHILQAINDDHGEYYFYDYGMGTLDTPVCIDNEYADYLMDEYGYGE